jgi:recombination protein RecA
MEHALDPSWAETLGVDMDKLLISQPDNGEQCLDLAMYMIKTGVIDMIIIDSVSALVPQKELEGESGDAIIGLQARLMSQAMRRMSPSISKTKCIAIFINQIREKIGITWGSNETTSGGRALKFFAGIRVDIRKTGNEKDGDEVIGSSHKIKIIKNKVAPPFKICEAMLNFKSGFDFVENLFDTAVGQGIISKSGNSYSYEEKLLGGSRNKAIRGLREFDKAILDEIYDLILVDKTKEESKPEVIDESLKPVTDVIIEPKA